MSQASVSFASGLGAELRYSEVTSAATTPSTCWIIEITSLR